MVMMQPPRLGMRAEGMKRVKVMARYLDMFTSFRTRYLVRKAMGRRKYDVEREAITHAILQEVFVADRDNEYGVRELHEITGLALSTISKWLHSNNNDLALHTTTDKWKWHAPIAHDKPLTVQEGREVKEAIKYDMRYPK
jgi:hypothetical protein